MTFEEIKTLTERGVRVCWKSKLYVVIKSPNGIFQIFCARSEYYVDLSIDFQEEDFFPEVIFDYLTALLERNRPQAYGQAKILAWAILGMRPPANEQ